MFIRKPVAYALLVAVLLIAIFSGAYTANAQTQNPPAPPTAVPAQSTPPFQPDQMMGAMAGMLDQMDALLAATDHPAHQQMAPAMMKILEGMTELNQPVTEQIHGQSGPGHEAQLQRMGENSARMQAMTERLHGMGGHPAAPAAPAPEGAQPAPAGPGTAQMQMGQQMQMMGMMMQMMGMMQSQMAGEMMGGQGMQMDPMMGKMMEQMGKGMMGGAGMGEMMGKGMMGSEMMDGGGMGQMGAGAPVTGTATATSPAAAPTGGAEQSVEGGGVTVKVAPLTLTTEDAATLDFALSLDTHTVELNYDLAQLAVLTDNLGNEYTPAAWTPEKSDGHHVGGLLSFGDRATILQDGVTELALNVKDVAGVAERQFTWTIEQ